MFTADSWQAPWAQDAQMGESEKHMTEEAVRSTSQDALLEDMEASTLCREIMKSQVSHRGDFPILLYFN